MTNTTTELIKKELYLGKCWYHHDVLVLLDITIMLTRYLYWWSR